MFALVLLIVYVDSCAYASVKRAFLSICGLAFLSIFIESCACVCVSHCLCGLLCLAGVTLAFLSQICVDSCACTCVSQYFLWTLVLASLVKNRRKKKLRVRKLRLSFVALFRKVKAGNFILIKSKNAKFSGLILLLRRRKHKK